MNASRNRISILSAVCGAIASSEETPELDSAIHLSFGVKHFDEGKHGVSFFLVPVLSWESDFKPKVDVIIVDFTEIPTLEDLSPITEQDVLNLKDLVLL